MMEDSNSLISIPSPCANRVRYNCTNALFTTATSPLPSARSAHLRPAQPPRHADRLEGSARRVEQCERALAISSPAAPHLHQCLVKAGNGAQRSRTLLVEHAARLLAPRRLPCVGETNAVDRHAAPDFAPGILAPMDRGPKVPGIEPQPGGYNPSVIAIASDTAPPFKRSSSPASRQTPAPRAAVDDDSLRDLLREYCAVARAIALALIGRGQSSIWCSPGTQVGLSCRHAVCARNSERTWCPTGS